MDRNELKKTAIESMNACGKLMSEGNYAEAKRLAEKAWNCYYELQKTRSDDEDFTDLIYWARGYYNDCENNLRAQAEEEERAEATELDQEYAQLREKTEKGLAGSPTDALTAAIEYLNPKHWDYFADHDINFSQEAARLLNIALNDDYPVIRGMAAVYAAQMYRQPLHGNFDIDKCLYYARYAVTQLYNGNDLQKNMLIEACKEVIYAACCKGEIKLACEYAQIARDNGSNMGVFHEIAIYGFRHNEKSAPEVEDQMYADHCWQGMLMHGQGLMEKWFEASDKPDGGDQGVIDKTHDEMMDYACGPLSKYADENWGSDGGYSCAALAVYIEFLRSWESILSDDDIMGFIQEGANAYVPWSLFYLGCIYDIAADTIATDNPEDERITELRRKAFRNYALGAGLGHRGSIRNYLNMLKEDPERNAAYIKRYTDIAHQLDMQLD